MSGPIFKTLPWEVIVKLTRVNKSSSIMHGTVLNNFQMVTKDVRWCTLLGMNGFASILMGPLNWKVTVSVVVVCLETV
jgi:hypothetical protein